LLNTRQSDGRRMSALSTETIAIKQHERIWLNIINTTLDKNLFIIFVCKIKERNEEKYYSAYHTVGNTVLHIGTA